ncbi:UNVERIFIED_CONTAM: S-protein2 [Sesamum radiatum]|uniref:S-protein homolog n=1 Tax=Sesamum radiatum TaxID=300843 RepID=A0AAW2P4B1_SESRA
MSSITKKSLFSLFVLSIHHLSELAVLVNAKATTKVGPAEVFTVHVVNNLPNNMSTLLIHCASKDDDMGNHTLYVNDDFHWRFHVNFWVSTMFFCRFQWDSKNVAHEVFNKRLGSLCENGEDNICLWSVKEDGFWIDNQIPPTQLKKIYGWY